MAREPLSILEHHLRKQRKSHKTVFAYISQFSQLSIEKIKTMTLGCYGASGAGRIQGTPVMK
jgi:hypothetical protein